MTTTLEPAPFVAHMGVVNGYRESLQRLQDSWEQLTLLGEMSGIAADMGATAQEFDSLTRALLDSLARRLLSNARHSLAAKAQMAIDILVRNLFERTADVSFLATDGPLTAFLDRAQSGHTEDDRRHIEVRFQAYVDKYSVYNDIIVLSPAGEVLVRLNPDVAPGRASRSLVEATTRRSTPYLESFGDLDLLAGRRGLLYSAPIRRDGTGELLGVLCLSFRFDDELQRILAALAAEGEPGAITLVDADGNVLATSDTWQVPIGARLRLRTDCEKLAFAGREHLMVAATAHPYQGYAGPAWRACALMPLSYAFSAQPMGSADAAGRTAVAALPTGALEQCELFDNDLKEIPRRALMIQQGLERSVWNGQIHDRKRSHADGASRFTSVLLQHVTSTGERIRQVFERAIQELLQSAALSVLDEARFSAALSIDILDRNLYERSNDCRWWAMDARLHRAVVQPAHQPEATQVLCHLHSLYTVYSRLVLLDAQGVVIAGSGTPAEAETDVEQVAAAWLTQVLALRDFRSYVRSSFERSPLYNGRYCYIFSAAVPGPTRREAAGAVAIVFDTESQLATMLRDSLPRTSDGRPLTNAVGLFVQRDGLIIASTDERWAIGARRIFHPELPQLERGGSRGLVLDVDGELFIGGAAVSRGYREYNSSDARSYDDVLCLVMICLCRSADIAQADKAAGPPAIPSPDAGAATPALAFASFRCGTQWLGLPIDDVLEAVDVPDLTVLPGGREEIAGMMTYRSEPVPVMDLTRLRRTSAHDHGLKRRPVLVCETAGQRFAIRVDELGPVSDASASAVQQLPEYLAQHDPFAQALIHTRDGTAILILLSAARILARIRQ
jgi:chemotaxis signal transduction protein